jgi:CelD/BcsL family acetyltransferase involved in cellulose biosynthesis
MKIEILRSPDEWRAPSIQEPWKALCHSSGNLEVLYQSPEWFEHVAQIEPGKKQLLIVVRDDSGAVVGVAPLGRQETELDFAVGARSVGRIHLPSLVLLGAEPPMASEAALSERLLSALEAETGRDEILVLPMVARDSPFRRHLDAWLRARRDLFAYSPAVPGAGLTHSLTLESTFEKYLTEHFDSKARRNIKRRVKLLGERLGPVRMQRYAAPDDVVPFLTQVKPVAEASWQHVTVGPHFAASENWEERLRDLARRGILRSYILFAGDRACAFVLGYEYAGVFYHVKTGYDRSLAKLAPGIGILYLLLEELGKAGRRVRINYGFGDADYKRDFGNVHLDRDQVLLMRRNARNLACWGLHASFRAGVTFARDRIRPLIPLRRAAAPTTPAEDTREGG